MIEIRTKYFKSIKLKYSAAVFFLVLFALSGRAQNFKGGLFAGMSASQVNGDALSGYDLPGFQAGFFTYIDLSEKSQLQLELSFIQKGAREPRSDSSIFYKARLNYIVVPLIYRYRWKDLGFEIGPAFDINVYAQESDQSGDYQNSVPYNGYGLSAIAGVNYHFSETFWIAFRTNNSITVIRDGDALAGVGPWPQVGGAGQRNMILTFGLHYSFF